MTNFKVAMPAKAALQLVAPIAIACWITADMARAESPSATKPTATVATAFANSDLASLIKQTSRKAAYRPISVQQMKTLERMFAETMRHAGRCGEVSKDATRTEAALGSSETSLQQQWNELGWQLRTVVVGDEKVLLLAEFSEQRGGGFYAIRTRPELHVLLQAPHSYGDRHTRQIAVNLFLASRWRAAAWNTCHRQTADVAHTRIHPFNAFMQAAVATAPDTLCVQLHGFDHTKRTTHAAKTTDLIVSDGTRSPSAWVQNAAKIMRMDLPETTTRLFPHEVQELGAQTNSQSQLLRLLSNRRFLHLEMNSHLRERLLANESLQSELLKDLGKAFRFSLQ